MQRALAINRFDLSVVVPVYNEEASLENLIEEVVTALDGSLEYEIIYVDDGSIDGTLECLLQLKKDFPRLRVLRLAEHCGQSTAMWVGVKRARASWIATLDGDGQNDPKDIHRLLEQRDTTEDTRLGLISGWRQQRQDTWVRCLSSRIANGVRSWVLQDSTVDTGCGLKVFRRELFLDLPYFDHMHRFLPALVQRAGAHVVSVPVKHRQRKAGKSKYGIYNRLWVGIFDLLGVAWLRRRTRKSRVEEVN
jgi:dolichol-phosphate mannosyltransferase